MTLHIDKQPFKKTLGIGDEGKIHLFLVNEDGEIVWRSEGTWSPEKEADLLDQLP